MGTNPKELGTFPKAFIVGHVFQGGSYRVWTVGHAFRGSYSIQIVGHDFRHLLGGRLLVWRLYRSYNQLSTDFCLINVAIKFLLNWCSPGWGFSRVTLTKFLLFYGFIGLLFFM